MARWENTPKEPKNFFFNWVNWSFVQPKKLHIQQHPCGKSTIELCYTTKKKIGNKFKMHCTMVKSNLYVPARWNEIRWYIHIFRGAPKYNILDMFSHITTQLRIAFTIWPYLPLHVLMTYSLLSTIRCDEWKILFQGICINKTTSCLKVWEYKHV